MYRSLTCLVVLLGLSGAAIAQEKPVSPAASPSVTLTFNQEELNALVGLLDAGVKALGLNAVPAAARVIIKLQQAQKDAAQSAPKPVDAPKPAEAPKAKP